MTKREYHAKLAALSAIFCLSALIFSAGVLNTVFMGQVGQNAFIHEVHSGQ